MYHLLADLVFVLHLSFIIFVIGGGLLVWQWHRVAFLHIPAAIWGLAIEFLNAPCPLTPLELMLMHRAGEETYQGGFVDHYLVPLIYPEATPCFFLEAGVFLLAVNCVIYAVIILRIRGAKTK
ncbi:MAG: DUF2784 domain-containing protein [Desulfobacterales bacterium]|nr:DUF2784 domain-containing protein [Desulfobacterales bacterium]